jgi:hypothetical protein
MVGSVIDKLLRHFHPNPDIHLSDERLAALFCGELSLFERWAARRHLAQCMECRMHQRSLEGPRAEHMIQLFRESLNDADMIPQEKSRTAFAMWLKFQLRQEASRQKWTVPTYATWRPSFASASIGVVFGLVTGASVFTFLYRERVPSISANSLLVRAENWDTPHAAASPGVAHQTVQIKTGKQTFKRSVYWDVQGRHRPKTTALSVDEEQLRSTLGEAGVDWNQPISASTYQAWHDRQHVRTDRIDRSGLHLLTLTTTVPDGEVSEESLTVRDTDFHPVARRVGFRDNETVEIAELDFTILPWSAVDPNAFEPLGGMEEQVGGVGGHKMAESQPLLPVLHVPLAPTPEQLDETELTVRLILNQLAADTGEQIEIHRLPQAIEVDGLVETEERKRELASRLALVPRLKLVLQSAAQMREAPLTGSEPVSVQAASLPDHPSALEKYLRARGRNVDDINAMAQQAFSAALAISHESGAIADLKTHFVTTQQTSVVDSATIVELLYSHHARLETALRQEHALLAQMEGGVPFDGRVLAQGAGSLSDEASRNLAFVKELTRTDAPAERGAEAIFANMSSTLDRIAGAADQAYGESAKDSRRNTEK